MQDVNCFPKQEIDPAIMYEASDVLAGYGMTVTDAFKIMLKDIVDGKWLPVEAGVEQEIPNAETQEAMRMAEQGENIVYAKDAQDFFRQLGV